MICACLQCKIQTHFIYASMNVGNGSSNARVIKTQKQAGMIKLEHQDTSKWYTECSEHLFRLPEYTKMLLGIKKNKNLHIAQDILGFVHGW